MVSTTETSFKVLYRRKDLHGEKLLLVKAKLINELIN